MDKSQAENEIKIIREVMDRSARYKHFSGLSGVISGLFAIIGCAATYWVNYHVSQPKQNTAFAFIWCSVLFAAIAEDLMLAQWRAKKDGGTIWTPATYQVLKAAFPGVFVAFVISLEALREGAIDAIPSVWALGYGTALCAAGTFSIKEVWYYGIIQLITGTLGLFAFSNPPYNFYQLLLSFGIYQIFYGIWIARKYKK